MLSTNSINIFKMKMLIRYGKIPRISERTNFLKYSIATVEDYESYELSGMLIVSAGYEEIVLMEKSKHGCLSA